MEMITLLNALDEEIEEVEIPLQESGEPFELVGRSVRTENDRTNLWWIRESAGSVVFRATASGSRSHPPEGLPYFQLDNGT